MTHRPLTGCDDQTDWTAEGLGNMAVSNAFGSNTFNIFVALAIPWLVGAIIHGQMQLCPSMSGNYYTYHVTAGKIGQSCAILGAVLAMMVRVQPSMHVCHSPRVGCSPLPCAPDKGMSPSCAQVFILVVTNMKLTKEVGYFFNIVYFVIIGWLIVA